VMFVAPPEKEVEWSDSGLEGSYRFLARAWRLVTHWAPFLAAAAGAGDPAVATSAAERALRRRTHDTIRRVTADIVERQQLNTPVSAMMELVNELYAFSDQSPAGAPGSRQSAAPSPETIAVVREAVEALVRILAPYAPHTCEELWQTLGHSTGLNEATWPAFDADAARADEITVAVQVNGKVRSRLTVAADTSEAELERLALADAHVVPYVVGKTVVKVVVAKGRLVSIAVK
jgi:leucyl-tRNA synthetase